VFLPHFQGDFPEFLNFQTVERSEYFYWASARFHWVQQGLSLEVEPTVTKSTRVNCLGKFIVESVSSVPSSNEKFQPPKFGPLSLFYVFWLLEAKFEKMKKTIFFNLRK
jgi:hypothetical protein